MTAVAGACALAAMPAAAASVLNVNWTSDCGKATCFNDAGVFTQTWSSAGAHGPVTVGQFLMDRGILGVLDDKTFRISFSVGGHEVGTWGSYNMGGINGDELNFDGLDFVWNPEDGDLVLTLAIVPPPTAGVGGGGFSSLSVDGDGPGEGPLQPQGGPVGGPSDVGVDSTDRGPVGGIPEPSAWALMIGGFGLAGATLRHRRRLAA